MPPNILWICSDQQRWDALGCYGNEHVRTPNIDRLAASGACFDNAFSQCPICTPSRSSFLTGRYPRTTRCRQNGQDIPAEEVLVTRLLADAGYECGLSGKLHLSACHPTVCATERRIDDGYTTFNWSHDPQNVWGLNNEYQQWLWAKGVRYETTPREDCPVVRTGMPEAHHQTTFCSRKAVDFIHRLGNSGRPWLYSVNIFDPHHAFDPPAAYLEPYLGRLDEIPLPNHVPGELDGKPPYQRDHHGPNSPYTGLTDRQHRLIRASYWAMGDLIDVQVGRMLEALEATGQRDTTIVVYMSDHGEMLGDHGLYEKGAFFYEPAVHVPLIVSLPGVVEPRSSSALVELTDLAQTFLDAAGLPHHPGMQGRSLWDLLEGRVDTHRESVYSEYYNAKPLQTDPTAQVTMVRTGTHKLVADHTHRGGELYDLSADPTETHNLWDDPDASAVKSDLLFELCNRMAFTVDPLPVRRAPW